MRAVILSFLMLWPVAVTAQSARIQDEVLDVMQIETVFGIMQEEAIDAGVDLGASMMPGRDLSGWEATLTRLNAPVRVIPDFRDAFAEALSDRDGEQILAYLQSSLGRRIIDLELSARIALNAPDIEAAVLDRFETLETENPARAAALRRFIEVNDLVDANVRGAMAANAAFLTGMRDGADATGSARGDIIADVWAQEPEIRASTQDWLTAFVALAYRPLSDADLAAHIAFSETTAGQAMNDALFAAFGAIFADLSYETGASLARLIGSEDL